MKKLFSVLTLLHFIFIDGYAQQSIVNPGLDKFTGHWQYINGSDTITMVVWSHYFKIDDSHNLKAIAAYYDYKSGNNYIYKNAHNFADLLKSDFMGATPYSTGLDSIMMGGTDKLKRKDCSGIFVISNNNNLLQYKRGVTGGGGMRAYAPGQGPLPGFTLPDSFTLTRIPIPSEERGSNVKND